MQADVGGAGLEEGAKPIPPTYPKIFKAGAFGTGPLQRLTAESTSLAVPPTTMYVAFHIFLPDPRMGRQGTEEGEGQEGPSVGAVFSAWR